MIQFDDEREEKELAEIKQKEEEDLIRLLAEKNQLPYIDLIPLPVETDALRLIPEKEARAAKVAPFAITGKKVGVAIFSRHTPEVKAELKKLEDAGYTLVVSMASTRSLEKAWSHYAELSFATGARAGAVSVGAEAIGTAAKEIKTLPQVKARIEELLVSKDTNRITRLVETLLGAAIALGASDIHLEPEENYVRLRFRLDGILQDVLSFDRATYGLVNSRLKLLAGLKFNIRDEAQDGRFSITLSDTAIEIRASILPGAYGESIVLRLLNPKSISVPLEELGMQRKLLAVILREIGKPNGMLLTTGPTGSGKTTTLYAFLRKIHTPGVKIITIEDPIEYHLPGIVQTQVETEKHYTFASGLRSALRQDPDVIMVGEIRDEETAEIAINASLTGHLVFSTLHTNNAAGTFPRLIDLGVNPKVISSAVNAVLAQRLVRQLCARCKKETAIPQKEKTIIERVLAGISPEDAPPQKEKMWLPQGCEKCSGTGYKGRIGIYEAILANAAIEKIVRENLSEREISLAAAPQGIPTLEQDGILKVLAGVTSLEELERVVNLES